MMPRFFIIMLKPPIEHKLDGWVDGGSRPHDQEVNMEAIKPFGVYTSSSLNKPPFISQIYAGNTGT